MNSELIVILCTVPSKEVGERIAGKLVDDKLAGHHPTGVRTVRIISFNKESGVWPSACASKCRMMRCRSTCGGSR